MDRVRQDVELPGEWRLPDAPGQSAGNGVYSAHNSAGLLFQRSIFAPVGVWKMINPLPT